MSGSISGSFPLAGRSRARRQLILRLGCPNGTTETLASEELGGAEALAYAFRASVSRETDAGPLQSLESTARDGAAFDAVLALFPKLASEIFNDSLSSGSSMSLPRFKRLVAQMPKIAKVVNQFQSPDIQRDVLRALVRAFESESTDEDKSDSNDGTAMETDGASLHDTAPSFLDDSVTPAILNGEHPDDEAASETSSIHL